MVIAMIEVMVIVNDLVIVLGLVIFTITITLVLR